MNCNEMEGLLDDFVDGHLSREESAQVEGHLDGCVRCRAEVDALRDLLEETRGLPQTVAPTRDLWAGIANRIGDERGAGNIIKRFFRTPSAATWSRAGIYAAAAACLVIVFASYTSLLDNGTSQQNGYKPARPGVVPVAEDDFDAVEQEYVQAKKLLMDAIKERETYWDEETVKTIEDNLYVIERAISDIHAAISIDPANKDLNNMLLAMYEREVDFLYEASLLPILPAGEEEVEEAIQSSEGGEK